MIGTIVNACAIVLGSTVGSIIKRGLKPKYQEAIFTALGVATIGLGLNSAVQNIPESNYPVLFILSMAIGAVIGTALNIEERFNKTVSKHSKKGSDLASGLSTAIMLFCIGTLSILGPINSALYQDETFLFTNATLDFCASIVLASSFGIGIALAAAVLFCWQGAIYVFAQVLAPYMSGGLMAEISIVGGLLILATGINLLKIKKIPTMNLLPALFVPPLWFALLTLTNNFGGFIG